MNIAVIKLKDLIKYVISIILIIFVISIGINLVKKEELEENIEEIKTSFLENIKISSLYCLKLELPIIELDNKENDMKNSSISLEKILDEEISLIGSLEDFEEIDDSEVANNIEDNQNTENLENQIIEENQNEEVSDNLEVEVISENNIDATYTNETQNVKINNQTSYDITDLINNSNYEITNKNKFIIYHTHTCESYTSSASYQYEMTGSYRTTDLNYTVSRVGEELKKYLEGYGKTVIHDTTYHDYPTYNGSYGRSLETMQNVLTENQDAEIVIDLHRDAVRK